MFGVTGIRRRDDVTRVAGLCLNEALCPLRALYAPPGGALSVLQRWVDVVLRLLLERQKVCVCRELVMDVYLRWSTSYQSCFSSLGSCWSPLAHVDLSTRGCPLDPISKDVEERIPSGVFYRFPLAACMLSCVGCHVGEVLGPSLLLAHALMLVHALSGCRVQVHLSWYIDRVWYIYP